MAEINIEKMAQNVSKKVIQELRDNGVFVGRWIPVSEELPKEWKFISNDGYVGPSDYVLVLGDYGMYGISRYWGNRKSKTENPDSFKDWIDLDWVEEKPIAWMPLPQPYKAESEEEK